jgi:hypothetical protein
MYSTSMKTKFITTTTIAVLAIIVATTTTATNVKASNNNDNDNGCSEKQFIEEILCGVGDAVRGAGSGYKDGNYAGINGNDSECPQSDRSSAYCLAWAAGYHSGATDRKNVERNQQQQNSDDGEFVPQKRTIQQNDTPKRTIGGN